jgi:hypothetical protein
MTRVAVIGNAGGGKITLSRALCAAKGVLLHEPEGCPLPRMTWRMIQVIWRVHTQMRPKLAEMVGRCGEGKRVFHLRSPRELRRFLRQHCRT